LLSRKVFSRRAGVQVAGVSRLLALAATTSTCFSVLILTTTTRPVARRVPVQSCISATCRTTRMVAVCVLVRLTMMTTDIGDREIKVQEAIKLVKRVHLDRYGFEDCNEAYICGLSDDYLDLIISANKPVSSVIHIG
jgi:hypothetical protein